jgi:hypothetical protein
MPSTGPLLMLCIAMVTCTGVQVLNDMVRFAGIEGEDFFTSDTREANNFNFGSTRDAFLDPVQEQAFQTLRALYQKPDQDLVSLIQAYWPGMNFTGLPQE